MKKSFIKNYLEAFQLFSGEAVSIIFLITEGIDLDLKEMLFHFYIIRSIYKTFTALQVLINYLAFS